jgi:ATP-dependent HslUV protease ATP-binding subunit HslU
LPIRVELRALSADDFKRILTETDASLTEQYVALMATEGVELEITDEAVTRLAEISFSVNESTENIGARRLHTVMERLLDEISYTAPDRSGEKVVIDADYVDESLADLAGNEDLSRYIL